MHFYKIPAYILLIAITVACDKSNPDNPIQEETIKPVAWLQIQEQTSHNVAHLSGLIEPVDSADVSFEVSGKLLKLAKKMGQSFKRGQILARLDQSNYKLRVNQNKSQLAEARARLTQAKNDYNRKAKLMKGRIITRPVYDEAKANYAAMRSQVQVAKDALALAQDQKTDTVLKAPYDGIVLKRLAEPAQNITAGQVIYQIQKNSGFQVKIMLPATVVDQVKVGDRAQVMLDGQTEFKVTGKISEIASSSSAGNSFAVIIKLKSQDSRIHPGMSVSVNLAINPGQTVEIRIPVTALLAENDERFSVFTVQDERLIKKEVILSQLKQNYASVLSGLNPGEVIVTKGVGFLQAGQKVSLINDNIRTIQE